MTRYTYFAIKVGDTIVIRKTLNGLKKVTSTFYSPVTGVRSSQITYTGGLIVGTMDYRLFTKVVGRGVTTHLKLSKDLATGLKPYFDTELS